MKTKPEKKNPMEGSIQDIMEMIRKQIASQKKKASGVELIIDKGERK